MRGLGHIDENESPFFAPFGPTIGPHDTFDHLIGAIRHAPGDDLGEASHAAYRGVVQDQGSTNSCVAFGLTKSAWRWAVLNGQKDAKLLSAGHAYKVGMRFLRGPNFPLVDRGSYPRVMAEALRRVGMVAEEDYPWDPTNVLQDVPVSVHKKAYDQGGLKTYAIDEARVRAVQAALRARCPVTMAMKVDTAFMDFTGDEIIWSIDMDKVRGGHMVNVLAVEDDGTALIENSWGPSWGITHGELVGCARISADLFAQSPAIIEVLAIRYAPAVT